MFNLFKKHQIKQEGQSNCYIYGQYSPTWTSRNYGKFAREAYVNNVIAHQAIKMISVAASSVAIKLFEQSNNSTRPVSNHPLLRIINRPNPVQSGKEFFEAIYSYRQISGNAFILASGLVDSMPTELYAIRPDLIRVEASNTLVPKSYIHSVNNQNYQYPVDPISGFSNILHLKNFNPLSDENGLSSIEAAAYSIDQHNQAAIWNKALLENGCRPCGAITINSKNSSVSDNKLVQLKEQLENMFVGAKNSGRPMVLEGGLEWKNMSLSPIDMDFITTKHSSARDISLALGVPPQLLGIPGDNTYSNLQEARLAFWEQTVIPLVDNTISHLSNWLCSYFSHSLKLSYDLDSVSALSMRRDALWKRMQESNFMTINEKRAVLNLPPIEGGDKATFSN